MREGRAVVTETEELLRVKGLSMRFKVSHGFLGMGGHMTVNAVEDVDLSVPASGSGSGWRGH
jgi:ABC-type oligopeptide transport system ATPase subunit